MRIWPFKRKEFDGTIEGRVRELQRHGSKELATVLVATMRELDSVVDILTLQQIRRGGTDANPYSSRKARIDQIVLAYNGQAEWGNGLIKRLLNIRRAYQMPYGLSSMMADGYEDADAEVEYIDQVLDDNNLAEGKAQEGVKQREIEGQLLVQILWNEETARVVLRPRLWRSMEYSVTLVNETDPSGPKRAEFSKDGAVVETLEDDEFAFVCFNADGETLEGNPEIGDVIWHCENVDRALFAWRKFNNLFAHLTPFFKTEDKATADQLRELIQQIGWKIGTAIAANADFKLEGPGSTTPGDLMRNELVTLIQIICGVTGVEPQDIGFPDVLSNRAVATEMGEPQEIATQADITTWRGFFEDLFRKIIRLRNQHLFGQLREDAVVADIKPATGRMWSRVKDVFLPAAVAGKITPRALWDQIPDFDAEEEEERMAEHEERQAKTTLAQFGFGSRDALSE